MAKQTVKQRKALRSEAAKRGWDTRIARERREIEEANAKEERAFALAQEALRRAQEPRNEDARLDHEKTCRDMARAQLAEFNSRIQPKPSLWQRIKGWFA